ncbi:LysR family transcriptional regulator [Streptomyces oryzae]|uniref:LysR family transcriptional regulator n=1 Tax=Streptomyces oryzae TaxID=1434886 RepID=A0ABS3XA64_9ACTN|nr:LysR family transcriptional regulator [Streptomyces oryzae]MBO8192226.1 LysR family transcriptional regulator [Streptomyces oryzae]
MIDPRLQTLRVLHRCGTVTATAEALHLTPSTVSQQLRQLAARLDLPLLEPVGRRVRLTPAALALLEHADALHARWEAAAAELAAYRRGGAGRLCFTAISTALATLVAPAAARLRQELPQVTVELSEDPAEDRHGLLLSGAADIAVVLPSPGSPPPDDRQFLHQPLLTEPQDLLVPDGHRFARRARSQDGEAGDPAGVTLADAAEESWIRAGDPNDQHQLLLAACAAAGFTPRVAHAAVDWTPVASLVAHGFGICLIPRLAPVPTGLPVTRVPLSGPHAPIRRVLTCVRRGAEQQPLVARGLAALRAAAAEYATTQPGPG